MIVWHKSRLFPAWQGALNLPAACARQSLKGGEMEHTETPYWDPAGPSRHVLAAGTECCAPKGNPGREGVLVLEQPARITSGTSCIRSDSSPWRPTGISRRTSTRTIRTSSSTWLRRRLNRAFPQPGTPSVFRALQWAALFSSSTWPINSTLCKPRPRAWALSFASAGQVSTI